MRPDPRSTRLTLALGFVVAIAIAAGMARRSDAQATTKADAAPAGPPRPLSSYAPAKNLLLYLEHQGLDARPDAWKGSTFAQVLTETTAGAMLEDVFAQVFEETMLKAPGAERKVSGAELVKLFEFVAHNGFLYAAAGTLDTPEPDYLGIVVRGVNKSKEVRPIVARLLAGMTKGKGKVVEVEGHKIVVQKSEQGRFLAWWIDDTRKEDLIVIPSMAAEEQAVRMASKMFAIIEGKTRNADADPARAALFKDEDGFAPIMAGFMDLAALSKAGPPGSQERLDLIGIKNLNRLDYRWGFQEKETVSIARIQAPKPHTGLLSILNGPKFDKTTLPPIPEGVDGFTVVSADLKGGYDTLLSLARTMNPDAVGQIEAAAEAIKAKTRLRLKEDILAHLGPKFAFYVAPGKSGESGLSPMLAALIPGGSIPRVTLVSEIDDNAAFGRVLDALMIQANQTLRGLTPMLAMVAPPAANPGGGMPGAPTKKAARPPTLEFKPVPTGADRAYMLTPPPDLQAVVPKDVRPTIRTGPKLAVFSVSPEAARNALEVKGGGAPGSTFASTLQMAPTNLFFLNVGDSSEAISSGLAAFPKHVQAALNKIGKAPAMPATPMPTAAPGGPPGGPGSGSEMMMPPGRNRGSGSGPGGPGMMGSGGPGGPGGPGGEKKAEAGPIVISVDPAKLPTAGAIKPLLYPGSLALSADEEGLRITTRSAFPDFVSMLSGGNLGSMLFDQGLAKMKPMTPAPASAAPEAAPAPTGPGGMMRPGGRGRGMPSGADPR